MAHAWSPENIDRVAAMLRDGCSASLIGERLRVSRNAIIGLVRRNKRLSEIGFARGKPGPRTGKSASRAGRQSRPPGGKLRAATPDLRAAGITPAGRDCGPASVCRPAGAAGGEAVEQRREAKHFDAASLHLPLVALRDDQCRWPVNDGAPDSHLFCGQRVVAGCYCRHHASRSVGRGTESERSADRVLERFAAGGSGDTRKASRAMEGA